MTETTVMTDGNKVHPGAFFAALLLAPLLVGLPAFAAVLLGSATNSATLSFLMIAAFPAVAMVVGAPTYALFGGPAFWWALKNSISVPAIAFGANIASLPAVAVHFALAGGDVVTALGFFALLGSIFAPLWGAIFSALYQYFTGGKTLV